MKGKLPEASKADFVLTWISFQSFILPFPFSLEPHLCQVNRSFPCLCQTTQILLVRWLFLPVHVCELSSKMVGWTPWAGWPRWAALLWRLCHKMPLLCIPHSTPEKREVKWWSQVDQFGVAWQDFKPSASSARRFQAVHREWVWSTGMCIPSLAPPCTSYDFEQGI